MENKNKKELEETCETEETESIYYIDEELIKENWEFNDNGVYIYFPKDLNGDAEVDTDTDEAEPLNKKQNIFLKIHRNFDTRKKIELVFQWVEKINKNEYENKRKFTFDHTLDIGDEKVLKSLNQDIAFSGRQSNISSSEDMYTSFVNYFLDKINDSKSLKVLKDENHVFPVIEEEEEKEEEPVLVQNQTFRDYDDIIQKEALILLKKDELFDKIKNSIALTHEGNKNIKDRLPLIFASIFVGDPVQTEMNADTGTGKTDSAIETAKNFPEQYIKIKTNISPKNMYYDRDSYGCYNIVIFDDVELTEEIVNVMKELSDNKKPIKKLETVIEGKAKQYELPGKYLIILTYAKGNPDEELLNRLYKLNIIVEEGDSSNKIKDKILDNAIIDADNNEIISRNRLIIGAAIQYLVDKKIKIFNPFTLLFNPHEYRNRDIKVFISFVKSKTFFHSLKRKIVEINGEKYCIGSFEDFGFVVDIWKEDNQTQKYKLNNKQLKILDILPEKTRVEAYADNELELYEYQGAEKSRKDEILSRQYTRKRIAKETGINENTVRNYLDKSKGTAKTLLDYGLIDRFVFDNDNDRSPYIYYKIKKDGEGLDSSKSNCHDCQIEYDSQINKQYFKIKVIYNLFRLSNIVLNKEGYIYLLNYCDNYETEIAVNDYDTYYNFINNTITNFDFNKYSINLSKAKYSDIEYMASLETNINNLKKIEEDIHRPSQGILTDLPKSKENKEQDNSISNVTVKSEMPVNINDQNLKKDHVNENKYDIGIFNKIGSIVLSGDLTLSEIQNKIKKDFKDIKFLDDKVERYLNKMKEEGYVSLIFENNVPKYHRESKLLSYFIEEM